MRDNKTTKAMRTNNNRRKGARFENYLARRLRDATGYDFKRNLSQYRESSGSDLESVLPIIVQAKHRRVIDVQAALSEAERECRNGELPIAILRWHKGKTVAVVNLDDFLELLRLWVNTLNL